MSDKPAVPLWVQVFTRRKISVITLLGFSSGLPLLLTSLNALSRDVLVAPAGKIAAATGWPMFFLLTIAAGIPGMLLLTVFAPWGKKMPYGAQQHIEGPVEEPV